MLALETLGATKTNNSHQSMANAVATKIATYSRAECFKVMGSHRATVGFPDGKARRPF